MRLGQQTVQVEAAPGGRGAKRWTRSNQPATDRNEKGILRLIRGGYRLAQTPRAAESLQEVLNDAVA